MQDTNYIIWEWGKRTNPSKIKALWFTYYKRYTKIEKQCIFKFKYLNIQKGKQPKNELFLYILNYIYFAHNLILAPS